MLTKLICFIFISYNAFGLTGLDVMKSVQTESQKKNTRKAIVTMEINDAEKRTRTRRFNYWIKYTKEAISTNNADESVTANYQTNESSLIKFFLPKNVKGTSLLTNTENGTDSKLQWIYLPAFKSVKRLSSSDKNKSFMGSDFTYSDIAGRKLTQDTHTLMKETDTHYYIQSIPNKLDTSLYSKIRYVISKQYNVIVKAIFYDKNNNKLKTLSNSSISVVNDVNVVMKSEMNNHQTNGQTTLTVDTIDIGIKLNSDLFSIKGLKVQ